MFFFYSHQNVNENYLQKFLVLGEKKEIRNCQILPTIYCAKIIDNFRCWFERILLWWILNKLNENIFLNRIIIYKKNMQKKINTKWVKVAWNHQNSLEKKIKWWKSNYKIQSILLYYHVMTWMFASSVDDDRGIGKYDIK